MKKITFLTVLLLLGMTCIKAQDANYENLALGKTATASSVYGDREAYNAEKLTDGILTNRWSGEKAAMTPDGWWVMIDFGKATAFNKIWFDEYDDRIEEFSLAVSDDGDSWEEIYIGISEGDGTVEHHNSWTLQLDKVAMARYLRLNIMMNSVQKEPSIFEIEVYNTLSTGVQPAVTNVQPLSVTITEGILNVLSVKDIAMVRILGLDGRQVFEQGFTPIVSVAHLSDGIYLVQAIATDGSIATCKALKK